MPRPQPGRGRGVRRLRPIPLGEQALREYFGFRCGEVSGIDDVDPEVVPLVGYRIGFS